MNPLIRLGCNLMDQASLALSLGYLRITVVDRCLGVAQLATVETSPTTRHLGEKTSRFLGHPSAAPFPAM